MKRTSLVALVAAGVVVSGATGALAIVHHAEDAKSPWAGTTLIYEGRVISEDQLNALQAQGKGHTVVGMGDRATRVFDSEAELNAYDRALIVAQRPRVRAKITAATRRCFGPGVTTAHGPAVTIRISGNTARVWPAPLPLIGPDLTTTPIAWAARFSDPVSVVPRTNGAMRFAVWSWSHRPTEAQDARLRVRIKACDESAVPAGEPAA
jgi:hypothetical protein